MKKSSSVYIVFIIIAVIAMGSIFATAQEYIEYIVKKGDTQWDIAEKTLKDPFDWPKVWIVNPEIKNPDLLYPGQKIRIPLSLAKESIKRKVLEGKRAEKQVTISVPESGESINAKHTQEQEYYTLQLGSFPALDAAGRVYDRAVRTLDKDSLDYLRIEVVKGYHTVRIGRFEKHSDARRLLARIKRIFPGTIILKAYIKKERIKRLYSAMPGEYEKKEKLTAEVTQPVKEKKKEMKKKVPSRKAEVVKRPIVGPRTKEGLIPLNIPFETIKRSFEEKEKAELRKKRELLGRREKERPPTPVTGKDEITKEGLTAFNVMIKEEAGAEYNLF
ncbi:MAG: LysM peptidoglycan-binding domain-containing protein, partial [Nitrospirae bacterium]|nr:LysM peptidoglycan-binding domain-containing protein [Nitrospirota bacterium]